MEDTSLITGGITSPVVIPSVGEIIYPATIKSQDSSRNLTEPGLVVADLAHKTWRKIILPVYVCNDDMYVHHDYASVM